MPFVIEKDNGEGKPPSFFNGNNWGTLENAVNYDTQDKAQTVADTLEGTVIVMPNNEPVFNGEDEDKQDLEGDLS